MQVKASMKDWIKAEAMRLGFPLTGITSLAPPPHLIAFQEWIAAGRHAGLAYMADPSGMLKRADPRQILPQARSILSLAMPYSPAADPPATQVELSGRVAAYAWGTDYHDVIPARLEELARQVGERLGIQVTHRVYTDTGPILERDLAQRAGMGWAGKNSCLIHPRRGSYFFLAELFLDVELEPDEPMVTDHCGSCRRCIEACPTGCIREDRTLETSRCISFLTIENKGPIPADLRPQIGTWVFGCDVCQQVCPWNRFAGKDEIEPAFHPRPGVPAPDLLAEFQLDAPAFNHKFRFSPIRRAKRRGYLRNVCIALGNARNPYILEALKNILRAEPEALVRGSAAWAIGRLDLPAARAELEKARIRETDPQVLAEITAAIGIE